MTLARAVGRSMSRPAAALSQAIQSVLAKPDFRKDQVDRGNVPWCSSAQELDARLPFAQAFTPRQHREPELAQAIDQHRRGRLQLAARSNERG